MNRRLNFWAISAVIVIGLVAMFFYGYGKHFASAQPVAIKIGYIPIADAAPLYVALEKGFFRKAGIEPRLTTMRGGSLILEALITGDLNLGFSNIVSLMLAKEQGIDFVSVGGIAVNDQSHKEGAILVSANSAISSVSGLKGRTIAINATKNIVELAIRRLLRKNGLSPEDVRFLEIPFPQMETVLKSGQVDAIAVAEPFWSFAVRNTNAKVLAYYFGDVYKEVEITTWVADRKWVDQNPALTEKLRKVLSEATEFLINPKNEFEVRQIIANYTKIDEQTAKQMGLPSFRAQLTTAGIKVIADDMIAERFLTKPVSPESILLK